MSKRTWLTFRTEDGREVFWVKGANGNYKQRLLVESFDMPMMGEFLGNLEDISLESGERVIGKCMSCTIQEREGVSCSWWLDLEYQPVKNSENQR